MNPTMEELYNLVNNENYHQAVGLLEKVEKSPTMNPNLLVLKGMCLQQDEDESKYSLLDIENMFKDAYQLDKECIDSVIELAWFNLNVNDDAETSISLFKDAFEIYSSRMTEIVIGIAKCLIETKSPEEAINYLEMANMQILDTDKIQKIRKEIIEIIES
jgi:tetratricopeptide (TPR) repeat protein